MKIAIRPSLFYAKAETNSAIDSRCNSDFIDNYLAKKDCLYNKDSTQCLRLALNNPAQLKTSESIENNTTSPGIAAFSSAVLIDSESTTATDLASKLRRVAKQIYKSRKLYEKAREIQTELRNEATGELTNGKIKKFRDLVSSKNPEYHQIAKDITSAVKEKMQVLVSNESDISFKSALYDVKMGNESYSIRLIYESIKTEFPAEYNEISPLYTEQTEAWKKLTKEQISNPESPEFKEYLKKSEDIRNRLSKKITSGSDRLRLVNSLMEDGWSASYLHESKLALKQTVRDVLTKENIAKASEKLSRLTKSGASNLAVGLGLTTGALYAQHSYLSYQLKNCSNKLNLSQKEVNFLTEYHLTSPDSLIYQGSESVMLSCDKFNFNITPQTLQDLQNEFQGVPKGICQLMQSESQGIDSLFKDSKTSASCNKNNLISSTPRAVGKDITFFKSQDGQAIYDKDLLWPNTQFISTNNNFPYPHKKMPCIVSNYNSSDENNSCPEQQIRYCFGNTDSSCRIIQDAAKNRVASLITSAVCEKEKDITLDVPKFKALK